jgi:hypothetical protein
MYTRKSQASARAFLALLLLLPAASLADIVNWDSGDWNGGSANGYTSGSPTGTTNGGAVSVQWSVFGTADGTHAFLGGTQPRVLNTVGAGGAGNGVLTLATSGDANSGTLSNYAMFELNFTTPVNLANGALTIQDVDFAASDVWQDFVAVQAFNGVSPIAVSYSILAPHALTTQFGLAGVKGTGLVSNSGPGQADGDVGVNFNGSVNRIVIYFFQGPDFTAQTGNDHGIWLKDVTYSSAVPEPSTWMTLGLGAVSLAGLRRLRRVSTKDPNGPA